MTFDRALFSSTLRTKLLSLDGGTSLREAARQSGVSVSTLSRLVNGEAPDIDSFSVIVCWLGVDANAFLHKPMGEPPKLEQWAQLYHSLQELDVPLEVIKAIVTIVKLIGKKEGEKD